MITLINNFLSKNRIFEDKEKSDSKLNLNAMSKEEALQIIENTPLEMCKDIAKDIWLTSEILDELSYNVIWRSKTERSFTSKLNDEKRKGVYVTKACGVEVFSSKDKFDSGTGWPSFTSVINEDNIILKEDRTFGMKRVEVLSKYGEHLGHVFDDGPKEKGGKRWCINGASLRFIVKN
ncbi:MAG: peptide-methionine (R)-S-oxide reductase MsrB [Candidatus Woesearchaeota archaeon]